MKVKEAIEKLLDLPDDLDIVVFAEGNVYPALNIQKYEFDGKAEAEIMCGWDKITI